jgi:triosephosphate isomerase (TIM)
MRRPLIAGNWKMNLDRAGAVKLAREVVEKAGSISKADLLVSPAFVHLDAVHAVLADSPVALGAQDVYFEPNGAFTGEISTAMQADLGVRYVILGHSERRHILGETDEQVRAKTAATLAAAITPIVCVGELLAEREAGTTGAVIRRQVEGSLAGFSADQVAEMVIAYEPVWAIGTGKVATPEQAEEVHLDLRRILTERYNAATAERVRILYGGSVKPSNAAELIAQPNIDGALIGGASLKAADFLAIAAAI